jgi:hypothetical protein
MITLQFPQETHVNLSKGLNEERGRSILTGNFETARTLIKNKQQV